MAQAGCGLDWAYKGSIPALRGATCHQATELGVTRVGDLRYVYVLLMLHAHVCAPARL